MANTSIIKRYRTVRDFVRVLVCAELSAANEWEFRFTNDMRNRLESAGERMSISDREAQQLRLLASKN